MLEKIKADTKTVANKANSRQLQKKIFAFETEFFSNLAKTKGKYKLYNMVQINL